MTTPLSRRTALKGIGITMALPMLEAMAGANQALGAVTGTLNTGAMRAASTAPTRMAFVFAPNGVNMPHWRPTLPTPADPAAAFTGITKEFGLSPTLEPIAAIRDKINVYTGLTLDKARANGDGPGDHARSAATFLTGAQARKTAGNDIRIGTSVDQFAAQQIGHRTALPSLELGCEHGKRAGNCDSGYSCAYSANIAWADEDSPMPKIVNPAIAFERLFGNAEDAATRASNLRRRASILDLVLDDSKRLSRNLGVEDNRKLDEYQTSVREIERRVRRAQTEADDNPTPDQQAPAGIPKSYTEHIDLMYDMMILAFRTDSTRISTFALATEGTNRTFPEIGVKQGHHHLSHHKGDEHMIENIRKIDRFYVERFAAFVDRMANTPDGEGTLLDHTMLLYGCGIADGNRHNHDDLPILTAGAAGGHISNGRLIASPNETPLCNLYVSMLERMGCDIASFGDSTGNLAGLST